MTCTHVSMSESFMLTSKALNGYLSHGSGVIGIWHVYTDEMLLSIGVVCFGGCGHFSQISGCQT